MSDTDDARLLHILETQRRMRATIAEIRTMQAGMLERQGWAPDVGDLDAMETELEGIAGLAVAIAKDGEGPEGAT